MAKRLSEKRASAQCCVRGSTQFCWRRSWGVIPASFGLCRENKGVGLVLVWDIYPQGSGLHILYLYKRWHGRAVWCCLLKCSGVVCGWHVTYETAPFLRSVWRTPTLEQQISFYNCARSISLSAQRLWALKSRKRQLWLEWAEPVNLTVVLWAGTKPIAFRIQNFPQPKSWLTPTSWEQNICYSHWACGTEEETVLQMERQHLCKGTLGCSYVVSWLCLVTTAGSWSCHFCKAICHLLSGVSSAVLWNEPGCKAKRSFFSSLEGYF